MLRQIGDKDQKIQNLEALLQKSKENISLLEKEREDLYAKIQAGEGETAVLKQLQEKNHTLQEQVRVQTANVVLSFAQIPVNYIECFLKTVHDPGFSCFKVLFFCTIIFDIKVGHCILKAATMLWQQMSQEVIYYLCDSR